LVVAQRIYLVNIGNYKKCVVISQTVSTLNRALTIDTDILTPGGGCQAHSPVKRLAYMCSCVRGSTISTHSFLHTQQRTSSQHILSITIAKNYGRRGERVLQIWAGVTAIISSSPPREICYNLTTNSVVDNTSSHNSLAGLLMSMAMSATLHFPNPLYSRSILLHPTEILYTNTFETRFMPLFKIKKIPPTF